MWQAKRVVASRLFGLVAILALVTLGMANVTYLYEGVEESVPMAQIWYEGRWKELEPFTAPVTRLEDGDLRGKVVIVKQLAPFETKLRALQEKQALGVLFARPGSFPPGFGMQIVDGTDRSDIYIPAMEAVFPKGTHLESLAEGTVVRFEPGPNRHKKAAESKYQLIMNLVLSFWELAIMLVGSYRVYQFYWEVGVPWLAIAPVCCAFEVVGASLRFAYTIVDPFFTYRMLSEPVSNILITVSFPFSEAAGILLTFFWAETLAKVQIRAVPFISVYKWPTAIVVAMLFVLEIICCVLRVTARNLKISPVYISVAIYALVAIALLSCYISCAIAIGRRISGTLGKRKAQVWTMSLRIVISSSGYIIMVIGTIMFAIMIQRVYGRPATLATVYIGLNLAGIMQVLALKPIRTEKSGSFKTGSEKTSSTTV